MDKHIVDRPRSTGAARLKQFVQHDRESGLHPAVRALHSKAHERPEGNARMTQFLRIARGIEA